jgi:hypothetical protein
MVAVGQMHFAMRWIGPLVNTQGSLFRMSYFLDCHSHGRTWKSLAGGSDNLPDRDDLLHFCIDSMNLNILFQYMAHTLSNPSSPDAGPMSIQIFDSAHTATGKLSFDFCVSAQLQGNINLYGFTLLQLDPKGALMKSLAFKLTSTDAEGIFAAIDDFIYSNPPNHPY